MSMEFQTRKAYATDLTDEQWAIVEPLMPAAKTRSMAEGTMPGMVGRGHDAAQGQSGIHAGEKTLGRRTQQRLARPLSPQQQRL